MKLLKRICIILAAACMLAAVMPGNIREVSAASLALGSLDAGRISAKDTAAAAEVSDFEGTWKEFTAVYGDSRWKKNFTKADVRLLSALIYAEANGMNFDAKVAVGNVVLNRMYDKGTYGYVSTVKDVIYDHKWGYQFSPAASGSLDSALKLYDSMDPDVYRDWQIEAMSACKEAAKAALSGWKTIPDDFRYFNSHLDSQSAACMENGWSFIIIERHIYFNKVSD